MSLAATSGSLGALGALWLRATVAAFSTQKWGQRKRVIMLFMANTERKKVVLEHFTAVGDAATSGALGALGALWLRAPAAAYAT